jgi:hypothetical protein
VYQQAIRKAQRDVSSREVTLTLTIELTPEEEATLQARARAAGLETLEYARLRLVSDLPGEATRTYTALELLQLPAEERSRYLREAAELAAPEYEADLALPPDQRELTAISAIAGMDFREESAE